MDFQQDFAGAQAALSQALVSTTRTAGRLAVQDLPFHRSIDASVSKSLDKQSTRLLELTQKLLKRCGSIGAEDIKLGDAESIDLNWKALVDATDGLLERADIGLDEFKGLVRQATPRETGSPAPSKATPPYKSANMHSSPNLPKPQLLFDTPPENFTPRPFKPFLTSKPHASVSLQESLILRPNEAGEPQFPHPYATEISSYEYPSVVYTTSEPVPYHPFETTTATMVDDLDALDEMLQELKKAPIIAIDLEHHDAHSYIGMVSLMQISTRDRDWIVDTLKPWRRKLQVLNEVFADPSILKVLHGAHMDIMWLQRDLGLYIVGLFDTHHASRVLGYPGGSLAYLLKHFVNFDAQKQYQMADWRMRPLPKEMFDYARSDTHYLLYVFDNMRNELVEKSNFDNYDQDKVQAVLERSKDTALQRYEYSVYDEENGQGFQGWYGQLQRSPSLLSKESFAVYRAIHKWRDGVAREEDENPSQIMTKNVLINVSQVIPRDVPSLLSICQPASQPVRARASDVIALIKDTLIGAADGPEMHEVLTKIADKLGLYTPRQSGFAATLQSSNVAAAAKTAPAAQPADSGNPDGGRLPASSFWGATLELPKPTPTPLRFLPSPFAITPQAPKTDAELVQDSTPVPSSSVLGKRKSDTHTGPSPALPSPSQPKKRKSEQVSSADAAPLPAAEDSAALAELKMRRKAEKKAQKQERKAASTAGVAGTETDVTVPAPVFDYAAAPSILHAGAEETKAGKGKHARFDPYAKASQAPGGVKGVQNSRVGKSQTFRR